MALLQFQHRACLVESIPLKTHLRRSRYAHVEHLHPYRSDHSRVQTLLPKHLTRLISILQGSWSCPVQVGWSMFPWKTFDDVCAASKDTGAPADLLAMFTTSQDMRY